MIHLTSLTVDLAWPFVLLLAWLAGEFGHYWTGLPRISIYAIVGFSLTFLQGTLLPASPPATLLLLANIALGLLLFEAGHRINLQWLKNNPWLAITSLLETILTFGAVYLLARAFALTPITSALLATFAMATSPATILRVINEQRSAGQVTERIIHLSVFNSVLSVLAFKIVVGLTVFQTAHSLGLAVYSSIIVLLLSLAIGTLFGLVVPFLLKSFHATQQDNTVAFAIAVIFLVALNHNLKLSPILATLAFGLTTRYRRLTLSTSQCGFGTVGDLLSVLLFVFIANTLEWHNIDAGMGLGLAIIAVRYVAKTVGISSFAYLSGTSWRKGLLISLGMTPISAFVILILEQTSYLTIDLVDQLAPLTAITLVMEILGPILIQRALYGANEVRDRQEI